jgi:hypothetical protein
LQYLMRHAMLNVLLRCHDTSRGSDVIVHWTWRLGRYRGHWLTIVHGRRLRRLLLLLLLLL